MCAVILACFFRFGFSALVVLVECDWLGSLGELGQGFAPRWDLNGDL